MKPWRPWLLVLAAASCTATPRVTWDLPAAERVVAIGDVHGSFDNYVAILERTGLVDEQMRWTGGNSVLVQTGDLVDRGRDVRRVLDLTIELQRTAPSAGGRVVVLWGNHEVLNLTVDLLDVSPEALATFADERSAERRREALEAWRASFVEPPDNAADAKWLESHPPGIFAYVEAFGPEGEYGRWLRRQSIVARVGDSLFVHGGIHPSIAAVPLAQLDERAHDALERIDRHRRFLVANDLLLPTTRREHAVEYAQRAFGTLSTERKLRLVERVERALNELRELTEGGFLFDENTPIWFRGFTTLPNEELAYLPEYLDANGVRRVVVGHMPQTEADIGARLDGRVFLIDTGMQPLVHEHGRPAALEIVGDRVRAIYTDGEETLVGSGRAANP